MGKREFMNLDEQKINSYQRELRAALEVLEDNLRDRDQSEIVGATDEIGKISMQLRVLNDIILRNSLLLNNVKKTIFVSTNFKKSGKTPKWIKDIFRKIQASSNYEFKFGGTHGGHDIHKAILEDIKNCHSLLSIVGNPEKEIKNNAIISHYIQEEIGVAFALCKPVVIAVQEGISPLNFGKLYGSRLQRIIFDPFDTTIGDWKEDLSKKLKNALDKAPRHQQKELEERKKIVNS